MEVIEKLVKKIKELGYKIILQGTMGENEKYPEDGFFTYFYDVSDEMYLDDNYSYTNWSFDLNYYTKDMKEAFDTHDLIRNELIKEGFTLESRPRLVPSDEPDYVGTTANVRYRESRRD